MQDSPRSVIFPLAMIKVFSIFADGVVDERANYIILVSSELILAVFVR